ncbi:protein disulfide-isomerase-like protein of the testis [Protopterus annectens]|uniref:protein disulfide-isomerase-like protein of the testis n=1 Tax=Protopterus annectens TaxID=7888 RepID=UPI001CFC3A80|nr:protein disulfide-isomerase-like protein of the testis [Protopterus annectens]
MQTSILLLLVLMFFLFSLADGKKDSTPKKIKSPTNEEKTDVLILHKRNFGRVLRDSRYLLVTFYTPLSGPSLMTLAEVTKAAAQLKKESSGITFGKVDVSKEKDLKNDFSIHEFPTLKFFINGDKNMPINYTGVSSASSLVTWLKRRLGPSAILIHDTAGVESFINSAVVTVVGFFKDLQCRPVEVFYDAAKDVSDLPFGITNNLDVFSQYDVTTDSVAVFKKSEEEYVHYKTAIGDPVNKVDIIKFIRTYEMDIVTEYNSETSVKIFHIPIDSHLLLFIAKTSKDFTKTYEDYKAVAKEFRGKILFIVANTDESRNGRMSEFFRVHHADIPGVRMFNVTSSFKYRMPADEITFENVKTFCESYLNGKIKPQLDSEEIPEDWNQTPVKVLVGKNFDKIVFDKTKNAFVMLYLPWSQDSKHLLQIWTKLGNMYEGYSNVVIAKVDCGTNYIHSLGVKQYPAILYFPAGAGQKIVHYNGEKTLQAFSGFLTSNGILPGEKMTKKPAVKDEPFNKEGKEWKTKKEL